MIALIFLFAIDYSFLSNIQDTILIHKWYYLGPFSVGMREGVIGIDDDIELNTDYTPDTDRKYPSMLVPGGYVSWQVVEPENDRIEISYPEVLWDTLQDYYGISGIYCVSYVLADFESPGLRRALIKAQGISSFKLNGQIYHADVYYDGFMLIPVILNNGINRIMIKAADFSRQDFTFKIIPAEAPLLIASQDITVPDIIAGNTNEFCIGIPLINTTDRALHNIKINAVVNGTKCGEFSIKYLESLNAVKIPLKIKIDNMANQLGDSMQLDLDASFGDYITDASVWIKLKQGNEAIKQTFISKIDKSCQYYSVLPPLNYNPDSTYALILTCHGAGVNAENQIKCYSQKDWAFIVAATNRRRYGFNWHDWGRLDFLEVLEDVKKNYKIDENKIYLTGHSMGGHGVWHIATIHPDLFAAIAASAGWTTLQLYVPWFLQKSEIFADPEIVKYRDIILQEDNPLVYLENLKNVPVYILQGGADDNVPAIHGRMFAHYLDVLGYEYVYNEVPGQGHWWDIDSTAGVDCVDLQELMYFLRSKVRDPRSSLNIKRSKFQDRSIKRAYFDPFVLVYGTTGDSVSTRNNLCQARYQSYTWWYRANGFVELIPDSLVDDKIIKNYNLILFGNATTNSIIRKIDSKLALRIKKESVFYNKQKIEGYDLCCMLVCPNPLNQNKLVCTYMPSTKQAEKYMGFFVPLYTGTGLPEFIVYDKSVLKYGWGGVKAAGFLSKE